MGDNTVINAGSGGDTIRTIDRTTAKTQVMGLDFGGDTGAGNEQIVTLTNPLPMQQAATYFANGTGNTSTAQLAAGATFTGTIETTLSQQAISLLINCDQPVTLTLNQYIDAAGVFQIASWTFNLAAGQDFAQSFTLNANYFNLTVKNTGGSTSTTLNINTYYGTIMPAGIVPAQGAMPMTFASASQNVSITTSTGTSQMTNPGYNTLGLQLTSIGTGGIVVFEGSNDNTNWFALSGVPSTGGAPVTTASASGVWFFDVGGVQFFRVRATALTSGTITGTMFATAGASYIDDNLAQVGGVAITAPVKGTQPANFLPTQDAKDSGRTYVTFTIDSIAGVTTEALASFTNNKGGTTGSGTSYTVTAGKTLRIQAISATIRDSTTTAVFGRVRVRSGATVSTSSGILLNADLATDTGTAVAGAGATVSYDIPDGIEVAAGQQVGISQILSSTSSLLSVHVVGYEY